MIKFKHKIYIVTLWSKFQGSGYIILACSQMKEVICRLEYRWKYTCQICPPGLPCVFPLRDNGTKVWGETISLATMTLHSTRSEKYLTGNITMLTCRESVLVIWVSNARELQWVTKKCSLTYQRFLWKWSKKPE